MSVDSLVPAMGPSRAVYPALG